MARTKTPEPAPVAPAGFVASAVRLPTPSRNMAGRAEGWQNQAWAYWESVGELRYVSTWIGNVMSRAHLCAARKEGRLLVPVYDGPAAEAMDALYGGQQGQVEMLQQLGTHLTVAGEGYIVNKELPGDAWFVLASGKVSQLPGGSRANGAQTVRLQAEFGTEGGPTPLGPNDLAIRLWMPHPRDPTRADSPVRANLATLGQIVAYDAHVSAQVRSRLAGNGILFISNEVDFPAPANADPNNTPAQNFLAMLSEAMLTPIEDPANPSAIVPIVAMVPTESLGKNEHLTFWSELDDAVVEMRDAAIKRLALGLDVPPEVLLGVSDSNHWNAWLSEESAVKAHLEPRLAVIAGSLTTSYLRPAVTGVVPDPDEFYVIADTSGIRLRPNRSSEAIELYNLGELSGQALRRETGFQPEDAPAPTEIEQWLLRKLATGASSPELVQAALERLGVLGTSVSNAGRALTPPGDNMRTDTIPQRTVAQSRAIPDRQAAEDYAFTGRRDRTGLAAACDVLVFRALERAGNRLRNNHKRTDTSQMAAATIYQSMSGDPDNLLVGAWDCAADVLAPYTGDVEGVIDTLDFYVRGLLASRRPHSSVVLSTLLATRPKELDPA